MFRCVCARPKIDTCHVATDDGRVYVWGYNGDYQLALGDESDRAVPVLHPDVRDVVQLSVGADFTLGLTSKCHNVSENYA